MKARIAFEITCPDDVAGPVTKDQFIEWLKWGMSPSDADLPVGHPLYRFDCEPDPFTTQIEVEA